MVQNVIFGDLSDFLRKLGSRLTDLDRIEVMTLSPLVVLTVLLGLFPALVLDLIQLPVADVLASVENAAAADVAGLSP
jgi:NADH-quinone oxidoreductase subunit M